MTKFRKFRKFSLKSSCYFGHQVSSLGCQMGNAEDTKLVELADHWLARKTGELLDDVQKTILKQALAGQKLKDIQVAGYSVNTVQREIAPKLWKQLSDVTGKKVGIKTVRLVLEELQAAGDWEAGTRRQGDKDDGRGDKGTRRQGDNGESLPLSHHTLVPNHQSPTPPYPPSLRGGANPPIPHLEVPGGSVDLASVFYVERPPIESRAEEEISKPGSLIRIKAPRQMGKTSFMVRLLHHAQQQGCRSVAFNFELADSEVFTALDQFLQWFCATVTDYLQLPIQLDSRWSKFLSSKTNCTNYFEKYLLPEIDTTLVLGLDAVDRIFPHEKVADDFFGLLRAWYEKAKQSAIWKNFRLVIVHGTEVYVPKDINQSPFNVGLPVELSEFNSSQVQDLARRHGLDLTTAQVEQLMAMVGGHPHLVRLALYKIARQDITLEQLLEDAPTATGIYADHLRLHLWNLEQYPELAQALKQVVEADSAVELKEALAFKLNSMGLVHLVGDRVTIRYDLYRRYFRDRLKGEGEMRKTISYSQFPIANSLGENVLAAIVFTDVKDSTQKQHKNQQPTLAAIHRDLKLMTNLCQQFEGQVLKCVGDGLLMYFLSAVKAVKCAQEIQKALVAAPGEPKDDDVETLPDTCLQHRIGIHLADVFFNGTDVQGDGVNIAARLQSEAEPGGICISWIVYEAVKTHLQLQVLRREDRNLKGIEEPVLLYHLAP